MAAVTGAAIAVAGLGMSAAQAIKASQDMKTANNAAKAAQNELSKISETNAFKQVQVPTLGFNLAQQSQAQRSASALSAVQSAGAEGVIGGVGQIMQAGNEQDLQLAAQADEAKFKRDAMQADAEMGISSRKQERDYLIGSNELQSENMHRQGKLLQLEVRFKVKQRLQGKTIVIFSQQTVTIMELWITYNTRVIFKL